MSLTLETPNLELRSVSPAHLLALIDGEGPFGRAFGTPAADGLRQFIVSDEVSPEWLAALRTATAADPWVHGFAVVHRESGLVVGTAAFKGPPDAGRVEIAYGVVPAFQGRGFATEVAAALVRYACEPGGVRLVIAHTAPNANASTRVLEKCGFQFVSAVDDPTDGLVWRWERPALP